MSAAVERTEEHRQVSFCVSRPWEPGTSATIHVSTKCLESVEDIKTAVMSALTRWVSETEDGRREWDSNCEDFNLGDLAQYQDDPTVAAYLRDVGIEKLSIDSQTIPVNNWDFDDCLVDCDEVAP
jgi:hypothetical protein